MIHHEQNRGLSAARNTGTKAATGDFIYYVDSDDEMTPDCIEKLVRSALDHPEAEMVIGNVQFFWMGQKERVTLDNDMPSLIQSNQQVVSLNHHQRITNGTWNKLIRKSFIEKHDLYFKEGIIIEDYLWTFHVMKYLTTVSLVKDITYHYYRRPGSIATSSEDHKFGKSFSIIYDDILHNLTPGREDKELSRNLEGFCNRYLKYKAEFPVYSTLYDLYRKQAVQYGCWYVYVVLKLVRASSCLGNPLVILEPSLRGGGR